jgi:hypothetical protein
MDANEFQITALSALFKKTPRKVVVESNEF